MNHWKFGADYPRLYTSQSTLAKAGFSQYTYGITDMVTTSPTKQATQQLDETLVTQIKAQLLDERKRLEGELEEFAKKHRGGDYQADFPQLGNKEDENAAEVALFSDNLSLEQTLEAALRDVKRALKRIEEQTYGTCAYCKKPIDPRRLMARPTSRTCINCKERVTSR